MIRRSAYIIPSLAVGTAVGFLLSVTLKPVNISLGSNKSSITNIPIKKLGTPVNSVNTKAAGPYLAPFGQGKDHNNDNPRIYEETPNGPHWYWSPD